MGLQGSRVHEGQRAPSGPVSPIYSPTPLTTLSSPSSFRILAHLKAVASDSIKPTPPGGSHLLHPHHPSHGQHQQTAQCFCFTTTLAAPNTLASHVFLIVHSASIVFYSTSVTDCMDPYPLPSHLLGNLKPLFSSVSPSVSLQLTHSAHYHTCPTS